MLPIDAVLPDLIAALRDGPNAVLVAPPGAGKTTAVAPALLGQPWCDGQILLLSPRRLAARAAAERMAELAGEAVGKTIGYATRLDTKQSAGTRILVVTEGIFVNRIQADPDLPGVSAVLFDEVHERSLDSDFGLALALDAQAALRPDLRLVAMSATLDGGRFAALMARAPQQPAPLIESEGRSFPLDIRHVARSAEKPIEDDMAPAIRRALAEETGSLLAFLPGVAEIERTAERLEGSLPADVVLHRLHGSLEPAEQRAAIAPAPAGRRKLVLATAIAETSITIDGLRVVVDSGLARRPRYDRAAGMTRLVTERASQAAVTQRAGRAGRQQPGVVYRLWEAAATAGLPKYDPPEILETDLSALTLDCAIWGVADPGSLRWLDPPPAAAIGEARERLGRLDALDEDGRPTAHGKAIAALPLPPRLGHMLIRAAEQGFAETAAEVAVLLSERGLGGSDADLELRLRRWRGERGKRAEGARQLAGRWARLSGARGRDDAMIAASVALAYPDRVAKRRTASGEEWISSGGRGFRLDPTSPLARNEWLAVAEIQGAASGARILSAAPIEAGDVERLFADHIELRRTARFDPATGAVEARRERRLGAIVLAAGRDESASPAMISAALIDAVRTRGLGLLAWPDGVQGLRARAAFAAEQGGELPDLSDDTLMLTLDDWFAPLAEGKRRLSDISAGELSHALHDLLGWDGRQALDRLAPEHLQSPAGSKHPIDYAAEGGPAVEVRPQALFGLARHPMVGGGRVPLTLRLTSPAGRPIQTTKDLPGFWSGSWASVAKEMRGRYPRHPWPDDPAAADPTLRTKKAAQRS
ncbi:ATP-dependent helicase HrpB [Rhizorhabdus dicambivorans]|uniref:ATP-dependent helicase HrpB n=1 Tax=Rhizorhabdus dicambivorans TaxID=1850238 RepID=A0A2A4G1W0_9SPHN|nr:ATP-dependent helicase HrpB [Rhizorhabdus dicambivorans]ATE66746.1 ATP-dependent helicase HrpB [Rhizorhabdus dicambivorans]PCE43767.1 ATP-dependent helicase HrpB [Rhizorhabdus dicambivorans]